MDLRELRGLEIAARLRVTPEDGIWIIPSQSGGGKYRVDLKGDKPTCTCDDFLLRQEPCKHIHAARLVQERDFGGKAPPIDIEAVPKRKTYKQKWIAYNLAQTTEKKRLQALLFELCRRLPDRPQPKKGRHFAPVSDAIFTAAFKVYTTFSSRRFGCDLDDAFSKGYLSRPTHPMRASAFLEDPYLTPILRDLIVQSSLPLTAVETVFAVDSTGFSTSRFVRWFDEKFGVYRSGHDWVKAHVLTGVKTNIIVAVEIRERDAADSPLLPELLKQAARNFQVREVSADKAYLSVENVETISALGAAPFIAIKSNTTGGAGGLFEEMFYFYKFRREEFLRHYHQRSNAESTFSMIKAKFRDHVRSRSQTAMKNEVLCKLLCHNLCCVIGSQCELGIEPVFWQKDTESTNDILFIHRRP
jgi:transposase